MSDIRKLLETMNRMSAAEKKSAGPKFPGYWKGTDPAGKAKDKMVGSAEESIIKDLNKVSKEKVTEWKLAEAYKQFKEQTQPYTGIDPIVRQRMGMPPASLDDVVDYTVNNPPYIRTGDGTSLTTKDGKPVLSGGDFDVLKDVNPTWAREFERPPNNTSSTTSAPARSVASQPAVTPVTSQQSAAQAFPVPISGQGVTTNLPAITRSTVSSNNDNISPTTGVRSGPNVNINQATRDAALKSVSGASPAGAAPSSAASSIPATPYKGNLGAREIQAANPFIKDVNKIYPGQRLTLPDSDEDYVVQKGDTLDKIGRMFKSGEIGGRVISTTQGGEPIPPQTPPAGQPARPAAPAADSGAVKTSPPGTPGATGTATRRQSAAPVAPTSTSTATPRTAHSPGTRVTTQIRDPQDPNKPLSIQLKKGDDGGWYDDRGRKLNFNKPGDLEKLENLPADAPTFMDKMKRVLGGELPSRVFGQPKPQQNQPAPATQPPARPATQPAAPRSNSSSSKTDQSSIASYATKGGRVYAADFNNPSGLGWDGKGKYTSYKTPEEGVNATKDLVSRYLTDQTPYIKGPATPEQVVSTWVSGGKTPADKIQGGRYLQSVKDELAAAGVKLDDKGRIPYSQAATDAITRAIVRHETSPKHIEKFAPFLNPPQNKKISESNKEDEKIAGRYDPDDFDLMVKRLGQRAREQDRKHGPVDLSALAKRIRDIEQREQTKEEEDPAVNMQDPDVQMTSQTSPQQDPAAVRQQQLDQTVDMATAKGTMSGLKNVLGPKVDTNALASAVTKISDGKPLTGPESTSMSALTPLISKAAETPQTAMALKTALSNAGMLSKQGK